MKQWPPKYKKKKKKKIRVKKDHMLRMEIAYEVYKNLHGLIPKKIIFDSLSVVAEYIWQQLILYQNDVFINNFGTFVISKNINKNKDVGIGFIPTDKYEHILKLNKIDSNIKA